jgi:Zn finger protein HypA/HybF involved in hydrogenase expression
LTSEEKRFCAKCGTELHSDSRYCPKCGAASSQSALASTIQAWHDRREARREARRQRKAIRHGYAPATAPTTTTVIQKEIVKIPCKYCGALIEITGGATKCPNCGAPVKF